MLEHQFEAIEMMMSKLREQDELKQQQEDKDRSNKAVFKVEGGSLLASKRGELARLVNLKNIDLSTLSSEQLYEIALDFVALVDKNKSGSLDAEEFYDFFSNAADIFLTDE